MLTVNQAHSELESIDKRAQNIQKLYNLFHLFEIGKKKI
jgi:hypothetical protein